MDYRDKKDQYLLDLIRFSQWGPAVTQEPQKSLINPKKGKRDPQIGPVAVMVAMEKDVALVRQAMDISGGAMGRILTSKVFIAGDQRNKMAVVGPILGAPYAAMVLEKLVVLGAQKIVFLGWCGSVQERVSIGDFLVPDRGVIGEGTSRYYVSDRLRKESRPSSPVVETIQKMCAGHAVTFHSGAVWSTDAPYRETADRVLSLKQQDVMAVDMESSALFTVGRFRRAELGALLVVSDEIASLAWKAGFASRVFNASRKKAAKIVVQTCRELVSPM